MAIKITINVSKKVPIPGVDFASQSASCSIEAESATGNPVTDAERLYGEAEAAVDRQLGLVGHSQPGLSLRHSRPPSGNGRTTPSRNGRPASPAQLRYLRQLVGGDQQAEADILRVNGVHDLADLSSRACSAAIDRLKDRQAR